VNFYVNLNSAIKSEEIVEDKVSQKKGKEGRKRRRNQ
jgi:hypothetical protein